MGRAKQVTLKPVAVSDDGDVILATRANAKSGGYRVRVNEALLELVRTAQAQAEARAEAATNGNGAAAGSNGHGTQAEVDDPPVEPPAPRVDSKLTPREIQALLRQGKSVASIAKKAAVAAAWVEKFEGPIAWERAGMAARAQRSTLVRARRGASALPLGEAVAANLKARGTDGPTEWDAVRHPRGKSWIVSCSFTTRSRAGSARWEFDPETEEVSALSNFAGDLGWVAGRRKKR